MAIGFNLGSDEERALRLLEEDANEAIHLKREMNEYRQAFLVAKVALMAILSRGDSIIVDMAKYQPISDFFLFEGTRFKITRTVDGLDIKVHHG